MLLVVCPCGELWGGTQISRLIHRRGPATEGASAFDRLQGRCVRLGASRLCNIARLSMTVRQALQNQSAGWLQAVQDLQTIEFSVEKARKFARGNQGPSAARALPFAFA